MVKALNDRGQRDIVIVDHLGETEKWRNLVGLDFEDFRDKDDFLAELTAGRLPPVEAMIHLGACSATTERDASYLMENNYRYTRYLASWCLDHKVRFVTASSAATYGDGTLGYDDDPEIAPKLEPLNMYGYSKHLFDLWALKHGLYENIAGIKYFNVYGPGEAHKDDMRSVVHKAWGQIRETGEVKLFRSHRTEYADGEQLRDFIYVKDAVAVTLFFLDHPEASGLFNCGTGEARSWKDLVGATFRAMDREPNIVYIDMPEHLRAKYQYYTKAEMKRLREAGYDAPFLSLEEGVTDYVRGFLEK